MGLAIYLSVHQCENVVFDDLAALNEQLIKKSSISELVDFYEETEPEGFCGFIKQEADGSILLSDADNHEFSGYRETVEVHGCWDNTACKLIAKHMTSGKLVFHLDIEGNDDVYTIITPKKVVDKSASDITF